MLEVIALGEVSLGCVCREVDARWAPTSYPMKLYLN